MFDTLTLAELYALHTRLCDEHWQNYRKMIGPDHKPRISPLSDEWNVLDAKSQELSETSDAVYAVIQVREQENADA